jgi:hypothetical protein
MPPRWALALLSILATVPPFISQASGGVVGSFAMFARLDRYHLDVTVETAGGARRVLLSDLAPHLSRDARRMLIPADGYAASAGQAELVQGGLGDLATLVCALYPGESLVRVVMSRGPMDGPLRLTAQWTLACQRNGEK